jgi:hypothetical protein
MQTPKFKVKNKTKCCRKNYNLHFLFWNYTRLESNWPYILNVSVIFFTSPIQTSGWCLALREGDEFLLVYSIFSLICRYNCSTTAKNINVH